MSIQFQPLPTDQVRHLRGTLRDIYSQPIAALVSDGVGVPCRHCLRNVPDGQRYLVLAWRPFRGLNPYTETGPIFLCAEDCEAASRSDALPPMLAAPAYIVRGYTADERICPGTGQVTPTPDIRAYATRLLENPQIAFVDIRSASNNCFLCRVVRSG
ncbi:DUF1203 domain-containing protein [Roseovarius sp. B08]|uniref:DUF1203 domain-containing protein n=1 Tax=Roseovarius sp. B08 TaxID=3449223 RepID=UPI003EDBCA00